MPPAATAHPSCAEARLEVRLPMLRRPRFRLRRRPPESRELRRGSCRAQHEIGC